MRNMHVVAMLLAAVLLSGCGGSGPGAADESKPLDQVAQEAAAMGKAELQKMVEKYEAVLASKAAEVDALKAKLKEIPVTEMMGEKAAGLKGDLEEIVRSVDALKERLEVYMNELKEQP